MKAMDLNAMLDQVSSLSELVKDEFPKIVNRIKEQFDDKELKRFHHIYVTGDGDSWHAAMSTEMAFNKYAKVNFFSVPAMEFLEYGADYIHQKQCLYLSPSPLSYIQILRYSHLNCNQYNMNKRHS